MRLTLPLALVLTLALPLTGGALAQAPTAVPEAVGSEGMKVVAQIPGAGGTDLEFFSRTLKRYRDDRGRMVSGKSTTRHFAVVGNQESNTRIVDITNPAKPYVAAEVPCTLSQGDVQVNERRSILVIANGSGGAAADCEYTDAATGETKPMPPGGALVDIKDVYRPKVVGAASTPGGAHNLTLTPDGKHLYISTSEIVEGQAFVPIFDVTDLRRPKEVGAFTAPGNSPHDIRFNAEGDRAYTAGVSTFRILDTSDVAAPTVISTFFPPGASIGHDVLVSPDGAFLFAGDEAGGGLTYPCPGGAVHTYDIRDESLPVYLGQTFAGTGPVTNRDAEPTPEAGEVGSCTAHVMDMNPDGRSFTLGWYAAGSRVFDFSALYADDGSPAPGPAVAYGHDGVGLVEKAWIRPTGGSTWSAKQYARVPGYIFSDDLVHGLYVTKLPPAAG